MIKCSVTINGTISRAAQMRTDKDNNSFVSFPVSVVLPAKSGINKTVEVSVSMSGTQTDCPKFQPNARNAHTSQEGGCLVLQLHGRLR